MSSFLRSSYILSLIFALCVIAPNMSHAAGVSFSSDISYGMHSAAVGQLQDFLRTEGYFHDDTSDEFFSETRTAVQAWQVANCLPATGYFGTLSRRAATIGSSCVSTSTPISGNQASSTPASTASNLASDDSALVVLDGKYYVRTTNGLMLIHGGIPHSNSISTVASVVPAPTHTLTISKAGSSGGGTVTSIPAGISCGTSCSSSYAPGTTVTLTATADGSSTFFGWSGACSGTGACTVTMNADTSVGAVFLINLFTSPPPDLGES